MTDFSRIDLTAKSELIAAHLLESARHNGFVGYDPFDGLNSEVLKASGLDRFPLFRLAWIQFFKRSPINFRPSTIIVLFENYFL